MQRRALPGFFLVLLLAPLAQALELQLQLGYHQQRLTSAAHHLLLHAPSATLSLGSEAALGPLLQLGALLPVSASDNGAVYRLSEFYGLRTGVDGLVGIQLRKALGGAAQVLFRGGAHVHGLWLGAREAYQDIVSLTGGVGLGAVFLWEVARLRGGPLSAGLNALGAYDALDFLHGGDVRRGVTFQGTLVMAWSWR